MNDERDAHAPSGDNAAELIPRPEVTASGQRVAVDELHHERANAVARFKAVDRCTGLSRTDPVITGGAAAPGRT
jgi:hypothetical protein